jgi:hypothetical protein
MDQKKCAALGFANLGDGCYLYSTWCRASGFCQSAMGMSGVCDPAKKEGEACDVAGSADCFDPAVCDKGTCKVPDPSVCK